MTSTSHLDEWPITEIRRRAEFGEFDWEDIPIFIPTDNNEYGVGVLFKMDFATDAASAFDVELCVVHQHPDGRYRTSLEQVSREYGVLQMYANVGTATMRFKQNLTTWGEYKLALATFSGVEIP